jgi:hypothetical protein
MGEWNHDFPGNYSPADIDFLALLSPSDMENIRISDRATENTEDLFMEDYNDSGLIAALNAFPNVPEAAGTEQNLETTLDLPDLCSSPQNESRLWEAHLEPMWNGFDTDLSFFELGPAIGNATIQPQLLNLTNQMQQDPEPPDLHHDPVRIRPTPTTMLTRSEHGTNGRRLQFRITAEARGIMLSFYEHTLYPTAENFEILALQTNLEVRKVRNWFNNRRSRQGRIEDTPANSNISGECSNTVLNYLQPSETQLSKESLKSVSSHYSLHQQPPLEAWISSSFESDPVEVANIEAAVAKDVTASFHYGPSFDDTSSLSKVYRAPSAQSSQASSIDSRYSASSRGSHISATSRTSRRGRRRIAPYPADSDHLAASRLRDSSSHLHKDKCYDEQPYMCTFHCGKRFKRKYDWMRHEEAVHFPRATWVCCASEVPSLKNCPYCSTESPDVSHLEGHGFDACKARSLEQRTFYRRDNFVAHIHKVHGNGDKHPTTRFGCLKNSGYGCSDLADKWKRQAPPISPDDPVLKCGFCGVRLSTWETRRDHLSNHFMLENRDVSSWWPERKTWDLQALTSTVSVSDEGPCVCRYCHEWFPDGKASHYSCRVWSCRFLENLNSLAHKDWNGNITYPEYVTKKYLDTSRICTQELFTSESDFHQHLNRFHGANCSHLKHNSPTFEEQFSRIRLAKFEQARTESIESGPAELAAVLEKLDEGSAPLDLLFRLPKGASNEFVQLSVSNVETAGPASSKHRHRLSTLLRKVVQRYRTDSSDR